MRLYWKIFIWFWVAMILVIATMSWGGARFLAHQVVPKREKVFAEHSARTAMLLINTGREFLLQQWLKNFKRNTGSSAYLLNREGESRFTHALPDEVKRIANRWRHHHLPPELLKLRGNIIVSSVVRDQQHHPYRLVLVAPRVYWQSYLQQLWLWLLVALLATGLVCYLLSRYLTQSIRSLQQAAKQLGAGKLDTRVAGKIGSNAGELNELALEFDQMAAKLEALMDSQQRLLQDVSHELRSPLARLQVATEIARRRTEGMADAELDRISLEAERLNELIGDILSLARLNSPQQIMSLTQLDLNALLTEIAQDLNYQYADKAEDIQFNSVASICVEGDSALLRKAIENVISNAVKYSDSNVEVSLLELGDDQVKIIVQDSGPGVPVAMLGQLFDPFIRADSLRQQGYGLGLAIAKKAIRLHHGSILAENIQPTGLRVVITLSKKIK